MRNYTADGQLKVRIEQNAASAAAPGLLALGTATTIGASTAAFAALQALSVSADTDGLALAQAPSNGVGLTLEAGAGDLRPPRLVTLTSAADLSTINFTIDGLDSAGGAQQETVAGPNNNTVTSTTNFSSVTSITPDGTSASNVEAGWPDSVDAFALTLDATTADPSRPVTLTSADNLAATDFVIVGTDTDGNAQSETIAGPNNNTVTTTAYFASITSITPSALATGNISAGYPITPTVLYEAADEASISHIFLVNKNAATQTIDLLLVSGTSIVYLRPFELAQNESCSFLAYEPELPLPLGGQLRIVTTTTGAVSYTIAGTEG